MDVFREILLRDKATTELPPLITVEISNPPIVDRADGRRIVFDLGAVPIDDCELPRERLDEKEKAKDKKK